MNTNEPNTLVRDDLQFDAPVLVAARELAKSKPWRGTIEERKAKFQSAFESLTKALGLSDWSILFDACTGANSFRSYADPRRRTLYLKGKLSVVTLLNLTAAAARVPHRYHWAVTLFKQCFPRSFARCRLVNGMLIR